jgi:hypothetical protein
MNALAIFDKVAEALYGLDAIERARTRTNNPAHPPRVSDPVRSVNVSRTKREKKLTDEAIGRALTMDCCQKRCVSRLFSADELRATRNFYYDKTERERMQFVMDCVRSSIRYHANGKSVCRTAFCAVYGISKRKLDTAHGYILAGATIAPIHANTGRVSDDLQATRCLRWLDVTLRARCDRVSDQIWILPHYTTTKELHSEFLNELQAVNDYPNLPPPSISTFLSVRKSSFAHVRTPRKSDLPRCDTCVRIREHRLVVQSRAEFEQLRAEMLSHAQLHTSERHEMERVIAESKVSPDSALVLTVDYSKAIRLPHVRPTAKALAGATFLELLVGGAIVYNSNSRFLFVHLDRWSKDADLMASLFFALIRSARLSAHPQSRARELHIYVDNSGAEFKNRYFFGFCGWLVHSGWFKEVRVSMLVVGHTHTAIDQMFSVIHRYNANHSATTPSKAVRALLQAFSPEHRPTIAVVREVNAWKLFFTQTRSLMDYSGHSLPRHFRFFREVQSATVTASDSISPAQCHVVFQHRDCARDPWSDCSIRVFMSDSVLVGVPPVLQPRTECLPFNAGSILTDPDRLELEWSAQRAIIRVPSDIAHQIDAVDAPPSSHFTPPQDNVTVIDRGAAAAPSAPSETERSVITQRFRAVPHAITARAVRNKLVAAETRAPAPAPPNAPVASASASASADVRGEWVFDDSGPNCPGEGAGGVRCSEMRDSKCQSDERFCLVCCLYYQLHANAPECVHHNALAAAVPVATFAAAASITSSDGTSDHGGGASRGRKRKRRQTPKPEKIDALLKYRSNLSTGAHEILVKWYV